MPPARDANAKAARKKNAAPVEEESAGWLTRLADFIGL
jgi:hypothetical protein